MNDRLGKWNVYLKTGGYWLAALAMVACLLYFDATPVHANETILRVGYADCDPIFQDEHGNYSGYAVAYLEELSKYTGWRYEYIPDTWENCMNRLESGELDLLVMAHYTAGRRERFLLSELPMGHDYPVMYTTPDRDIFYQDYQSFDGCRIGVSAETSFEDTLIAYLKELNLDCEVVPFPTDADVKDAILRGDIEMMVSSVFTSQDDVKVVDRFSIAPGYIAVNLQNKVLMDQINSAMQKVRIHTPDLEDILMNTFYQVSPRVSNLYLTREEQEYLDSVGPIVIKSFEDRHPMGYTDANGEFQGVLVDYLNQLGAMSGVKFVYEAAEYPSFDENVASMEEEGFGLLWAGDSVEMMGLGDVLHQSDPLFDTTLAYVRRQGEYVTKYDQHTFVVSTDMQHIEQLLLETNADSKILYFDVAKDCMDAVLRGDAEMAILSDQVAAYWLQKPIYSDKLTRVAGSGAYVYGMRLYVPQKHRHLVNILNKTLDHMSDTQKLYMVDNAALSHTYTYQMEDALYEYDSVILVFAILILVIFGMWLGFSRLRFKMQKKESDALRQRLQTDELTGTYSRSYFLEKAEEMIQKENSELYIVRVNICHFKLLNELRGIEKCDKLLRNIGTRLNELGEEYGFIVSRFTADHFYLCIRKADFERIELVKRLPVSWLKMDITITYGVCPVDRETPVNVMCDRANMALSGNSHKMLENIYYYNDSFHQKLIQEQEIENDMEKALEERQFCIYIQPKINVATDQLIGGEALVRWMHPQKGMIPPGAFISVFEKNGFILPLDYYVWEESCRFLAEAKEKGMPYAPLSINVSRLHFYSGELVEKLTSLLEKYHLEAKDLELEITESIYAEDPESILRQCGQLQALGFKIAMDDFGSGFSSLNMLKNLPLDIIKMDLKFLADDAEGEQSMKGRDILRTQIELAHTIGLDVVVEGLETRVQRDFIREIGSCAAQGYYYARPMPASEFADLLQSSDVETTSHSMSGTAARLRRERLRREQLQPLLEMILSSESLIGYLLPEKDGVLCGRLAKDMGLPQQVPNLADHIKICNIISPESMPQFESLIDAAERGESSGAAIVEYITPQGAREVHWLQFDTVMDYEGNPLIAIFNIMDFGNISTLVEMLTANKRGDSEKNEPHGENSL